MEEIFVTDKMRAIGPRIRDILDMNNIAVRQAAEDLNIERTYYYRLLSGERPLTMDNIIAHSEYLNVSVLYIIFGIEAKDIVKSKIIEPGEINVMIDMILEAIIKLDDEEKKEKMSKILNVLNVILKSMN